MSQPRFVSLAVLAFLLFSAALPLAAATPPSPPPALDVARLDALTGFKGTYNGGERVYKIAVPRADVTVAVGGWDFPPFLGLTSWIAFQPHGNGVMAMGDLVLLQDEVNPTIDAAFANGLEVTALHNHFFYDQPRVFFMHVAGHGPLEKIAAGAGATLRAARELRARRPAPNDSVGPPPPPSAIHGEALAAILGAPAQANKGMAKFVFGRQVTMDGATAGSEMGVNSWAAFGGSDDDAVVDGDLALAEDELQPALRALRGAQINIVAIHQHMTGESPRLLFVHYFGRGAATALAHGVRAAIDVERR
ncbi:MAG: DUF1259 domain-containing protein [Acidobacteriota bacterium]